MLFWCFIYLTKLQATYGKEPHYSVFHMVPTTIDPIQELK